MKKKSATIARNKLIVGHNCASYNDKHPENVVALRPIHDAIKALPPIYDVKGIAHKDYARAAELRRIGGVASKAQIHIGLPEYMRGATK